MRDDADHSTSDRQAFDRASCCVERLGVESSKSFVDEQTVERYGPGRILYLLTQLEGERQRRKKSLSPAEGIGATELPGIVVVYDIKRLITAFETIPSGKIPQTLRRAGAVRLTCRDQKEPEAGCAIIR